MPRSAKNLPTWDDEVSPGELEKALAEGRFEDANEWIKALLSDLKSMPRRVPATTATVVLSSLRGHAWFRELYAVATELERGGQKDREVQRQLAQARIEQGATTAAIDRLLDLRDALERELAGREGSSTLDAEPLKFELGEVLGLLGRAYKQLYVDARPTAAEPRQHDFDCAREFYRRAFTERLGDYLWHGVNYIALLTHAERIRQGDPVAYSHEAIKHAEMIASAIEVKERSSLLQPWDLANRVECMLAIGDNRRAIEAAKTYLDVPGINAFNAQSTRRQLIQLWMLNEHDLPGRLILPMITARLAQLGGSARETDLPPAESSRYEKVYGDTGYQPLQWLRKALERARCVARLGPDKFEGWGTGFLFDGTWLGAKYASRHLLLTNAHVVSDDAEVQRQFPNPKGHRENTAVFLGAASEDGAAELRVLDLIWTSPPAELDATLLEIEKPPARANPPPLADRLPATEGASARLNLIGHPRGFNVRVSLQDNQVIDVGDPYVHYRTPTDPGSSGSPVFNQKWELVALHHASSKALSANEGVRMDRVVEAIRKDLR
jgi:hypothetical protein